MLEDLWGLGPSGAPVRERPAAGVASGRGVYQETAEVDEPLPETIDGLPGKLASRYEREWIARELG